MKTFKELGISEDILRVIKKLGFEAPTEIQEKTIPAVLDGKDVVAESATGSGKTLAFAIGLLQSSIPGKGIQGLIITPTRELANQIVQEIGKFAKHKNLKFAAIFGGVAINPQFEDLKRAEIVIGTPGRLLDHIGRGSINLSRVSTVILDEADRMFDMGFIDDTKEILSHTPKKRQTLLFSATISGDVIYLSKRFMNEPIKVNAASRVDPKKLKQIFYDVDTSMKFSLLVHLLNNEKAGLVMIFCNTRNNVDFIAKNLKSLGIDAIPIHGGLTQTKRTKTMNSFNAQKVEVLVCTDVAARGLDIKGVSHVYNYDIPNDSKQYIHRIGRTARAGEEGIAISIVSRRDYDNFERVEKEQDVKVKQEKVPELKKVEVRFKGSSARPQRRNSFRPRGRR